tara:strand:+ start:1898 stop:2488 length:591 start_codon:yes stop_codon:yes gene_type:complete
MTHPECFGREYLDDVGDTCPHEDCLLRYECKQVFATARRVLASSRSSSKDTSTESESVTVSLPVKKRKSGYAKPGKLLYVDEGTLRDSLVFEVKDYLEDFGYKTRTTKCLHSFVGSNNKFLLKVDTRRKNSILLYVNEGLSDHLFDEGFKCRSLFDSEKPNFPSYLKWVATLRSESEVERFKSAFEKYRVVENDIK